MPQKTKLEISDHPWTERIHELILRIRERSGQTLYTGTSFCGEKHPSDAVLAHSNIIFLHGNGVNSPDGIRATRACPVIGEFRPNANGAFSIYFPV